MSETDVDSTVDKVEDTETQKETIDDLFADKPEKESKVEAEDETDKVETEAKKTESEKVTDKEAETTAAEEKPVPLKALTEERRKRQEAEKRADEAEAKLLKPPEEEKIPDPVEDPEGYKNHMEDKRHLDALKVKVSLSRDIMLDAKTDYAEKENIFVTLARKNPFLVQQMNASPNPAKFAYQTATEHLETEKLRDPKYKETLKEEIRKEVLAELQKKPEEKSKKSALEVPDLTQATAAGKNSDKVEKESTLDDIISDAPIDGRKRK